MKGHPLMFYLSGKDIASVRFSSKREQIYFMDWTEQREEYGSAQNFTVPYGEDESECMQDCPGCRNLFPRLPRIDSYRALTGRAEKRDTAHD